MEQSPSSVKLSPVYGIAIAIIAMVLTVIFYLANQYGTLWTGFCTSLVFFLGVLISIIHYNGTHSNRTSMMSSFAMGFRTTILATILISVFTIVFHFLIVTGSGHQMAEEGTRVIQNDETGKQKFWIMFLGNILFANIAMGLLAAIIGSLVFKANQKTTRNTPKENV